MPTAEIELRDSVCKLVGGLHQGVRVISTILNITRIHNAVNSIACMRRAIAVARDYAHRYSASSVRAPSLRADSMDCS